MLIKIWCFLVNIQLPLNHVQFRPQIASQIMWSMVSNYELYFHKAMGVLLFENSSQGNNLRLQLLTLTGVIILA